MLVLGTNMVKRENVVFTLMRDADVADKGTIEEVQE
jgi:hypothetical protein